MSQEKGRLGFSGLEIQLGFRIDLLSVQNWVEGVPEFRTPQVRLDGQQKLHTKRKELSFYFSTLYLIKYSNVERKSKDIL